MKRDMNLLRQILFTLEDFDYNDFPVIAYDIAVKINCNNIPKLCYHLKLLEHQNLIVGKDVGSKTDFDYLVNEITFEGQDYLDAIRNDSVWNKAISYVQENGLQVTLEVLKSVCINYISGKL